MWVPAHSGIKGNEEADEVTKESLWRPLTMSSKWTDRQEFLFLKVDNGPGWNQGVTWLRESQTSVGTLVLRASYDDDKRW
jgi:hypothetical protein